MLDRVKQREIAKPDRSGNPFWVLLWSTVAIAVLFLVCDAVCHGAAPKADVLTFAGSTDGKVTTQKPSLPASIEIDTAVPSAPNTTAYVAAVLVDGMPVLKRFIVTVIIKDSPNPPPVPPVPPDPPVPPVPAELCAIVVEEQSARTAQQGVVLGSAKVRSAFSLFRVVDQHVVDGSGKLPADLAPYLTLAAGKTLPYLMIVGKDGTGYWKGAMPTTVDGVLKVVADLRKGQGR
jgi:hypothetical protein